MWKYVVLVGSCGCPLKMSLWQACNDWQKLVFSMESKWFLHNPVFRWGKPSVFLQREQEEFWWEKYNQLLQAGLLCEAQLTDQSVWGCSVAVSSPACISALPAAERPLQKAGMVEAHDFTAVPYCSLGKYKMFFQGPLFHVFFILFAHRRNKLSVVARSYRPALRTDVIPLQFSLEKIEWYSVLKGASSLCCDLEIGWKEAKENWVPHFEAARPLPCCVWVWKAVMYLPKQQTPAFFITELF